jgi:hypothetical protein
MKKIFYLLVLFYTAAFAQNEAYLNQISVNTSEIYITQNNGNNLITGPVLTSGQNLVEDATGNLYSAALQKSLIGSNNLVITQENAVKQNKIELYQSAFGDNKGNFQQFNGSNTLQLQEHSVLGSNNSNIKQENGVGYISIYRYAERNNTIPSSDMTKLENPLNHPGIYQNGINNNISGAYLTGASNQPSMYDYNSPAIQVALLGSNWLEIRQTGNNNNVGLVQSSSLNNEALISQANGNNNVASVQNSLLGSNSLMVEQTGNKSVYIYQHSYIGNNAAIVIQH